MSEHTESSGARSSRVESRMWAAGRNLRVLGGNLAALAHALRRGISTARRRMGSPPFARVARVRSRLATMLTGILVLPVVVVLTAWGAMLWALDDLPDERSMVDGGRPLLLLEAADGTPLGRIGPLKFAESARTDFPEHLVQAVLSAEDRRFYSHFGIDLQGIARAFQRNAEAGDVVEGGSTITQQLIKIRYLGNDRTLTRKLREALTAIFLELHQDKDTILTRYLNSVYLGGGAYGVPAAARLYFDKNPSELTLSESAMLAGLIKAPSQNSPLRDLEAAQQRAATVLDSMVSKGALDAGSAAEAKASPAQLKVAAALSPSGSWFSDWLAKEAMNVSDAFTRSISVRTTLTPKLQSLAVQVVNDVLVREGHRAGAHQAALVALRPDGAVLAMVGGRDYSGSQFNRAAEANRHPGSAFKLFVYLAALRNGYLPQDTIDARPIEIRRWRPQNFGGRQYGSVTLADAFAQSINTAAVRLGMKVGLDEVIRAARDLGIDAPLAAVPSVALGAVEVSLLDLTGAYASVRAGRERVQPWGIAAFKDGQLPSDMAGQPAPGQSLGAAQQPMIDLLRLVVERGTGRGAALDGFAAGKTGTSQRHRDAWFLGFNDSLVVGVWVGNDDGTPMNRVVGGALPALIWKRFMTEATRLLAQEDARVAQARDIEAPQQRSDGPGQEQCDVKACAEAYSSFRAADCTYQSYAGPRRVCEKGTRPIRKQEQQAIPTPADARAQAQCNIDVCARFYKSFNPSDCSYQPLDDGSRRICTR